METPRSQTPNPNQPLSSQTSSSTLQSPEEARRNERMHEKVDQASEKVTQAQQHAREMADEARVKMREGAQRARVKSEQVSSNVKGYIRENPMMALGVAFAAGTILASMGRRH